MAATNVIQIWGNNQLIGQKATVSIAGLDAGDYCVQPDGSVLVPLQSDPDGLLTAQYLIAASVDVSGATGDSIQGIMITDGTQTIVAYVPVIIGYNYISRGQLLRPATEAIIKSQAGPGLGKTRRSHMYSMLLNNAGGLSVGTVFGQLMPAQFKYPNQTVYLKSTPFSGVQWDTLEDDYSFDSMLAWQINRPYPCVVVSAGAFLHTQDR